MTTDTTNSAGKTGLLSTTANVAVAPAVGGDHQPRVRYTRKKGVELLRSLGFEMSDRYFETLASPGVGRGPPIDCIFNGRYLYLAEDLIRWAEGRCRQPGQNAA
jgi:hypothetical protein